MSSTTTFNTLHNHPAVADVGLFAGALLFLLVAMQVAAAQVSVVGNTMTVDDAPGQEVFAYGKNVIVKQNVKGVLAIGGDITIEGHVDGDVATIGGSVVQREGAYVGGDILVLGGRYTADGPAPLRAEGKETVMYAGYEEELRDLAQNPSQIFGAEFSLAFLAQRLVSLLFWFVVTLGVSTIAPGAVSRGIARFNLSSLKVLAIGFAGMMVTTIGVLASLSFLPDFLSAIIGLMAFLLLMLSYVFGRVALHLSVGQMIQKRILSDERRSETFAIFIGVLVWTVFLSIPYVWSLAIVALFAAGVGLVLTARSKNTWKTR